MESTRVGVAAESSGGDGPGETTLVADLGASSFRVALFAGDGHALATAARPHRLGPEADPEGWLATFAELVAELLAPRPALRVAAIAITAFTRTEIHLDGAGMPLRPAITFLDTRAVAEAAALELRLGTRGVFSAVHPLARLAWLARHEPAVHGAIVHVVQPKDFLNFRLTGRLASDPASNVPLVGDTRDYLPERLAAAGVPATLFPALSSPRHGLGPVREGLPGALARLAGARVVVGAMDTWAATLGLGVHEVGLAYNLAGTTEVNGMMLAAPVRAEGLLGVAWDDGLFHLGGPSQAGAGCLAWLAGLLGTTPESLAHAAAAVDPAAAVPTFLPYLDGERVPFWDARLRGGFMGLVRDTDPGMLARAVMEAVAFHDRLVLGRAAAAAGGPPREVVLGGGGASSTLWCQIKADCWALPLHRPDVDEPGLRGGHLLASGRPSPPPVGRRYVAAPRRAALLEPRYRRFLAEVEKLRGGTAHA
ncbi:MAG: carbohydrate kinase [Alphaproteobacteria bacterium]|nr:carbohydrate kinase [Alphaproteobacteria bacterium]